MNTRILIKKIYLFFTIFSILTTFVTNTDLFDVIPAIILMWITYFIFAFGYGKDNIIKYEKKDKSFFSRLIEKIMSKRIMVLLIAIVFSILISYFYTGNTPANILKSLLNGNSLYYQYQAYYKSADISTFSFAKIPYILMNATLNLLFISSVINIIIKKEKIVFKDIVFLILITASFLYFGLSRGTNFELFEIGCIYLYSIVMRFKILNVRINKKSYIFLIVVAIIGMTIFLNTFDIRGASGEYITNEIHYDSTKALPSIAPNFSHSISKLTSYFGFGFFYTTAFFTRLIPGDSNALLYSFVPCGFQLFEKITLIEKMKLFINNGVNWKADIVWLIGLVGFFGLIIVFYFLGKLSKSFFVKSIAYDDYIYHIANYYLFLQMFSFPIGNFIRTSSANLLVVFFTAVLLLFNVIKKKS